MTFGPLFVTGKRQAERPRNSKPDDTAQASADFEVSVQWLVEFGPYSSREQIIRLANEGVTVKAARGLYLAGLSLRNLYQRELDKVKDAQLDDADPYRQALIDNLHAKTRLNELELARLEGELMPVSGHVEQMAEMAKFFATFLDTLPDVLERSVALTADQVAELVRKITSVRADLYKNALSLVIPDKQPVERAAGSGGDDGDSPAAEAKPRQRKRSRKPAD